MSYFRINEDGTLQSGRKKWLDDCIESSQIAKDENGIVYDFYLHEPDDEGVYQPDLEAIAKSLEPTEEELKLQGVDFEGTMCSATKEDMWGLTSVKIVVEGGGSTNFQFDNGNILLLTPENYQNFMAVWTPFRLSFFN